MALLDNCIFCKIIKGSIPCHKVIENSQILAFMDINPLSKGHILVVPKYHGSRLHDMPEEYLHEVLPIARRIALTAFVESGTAYNILQNNGRLAHQEVDHVHFHVIPKRDEDEGLGIRWATKSASHDELANFASDLQKKLSSA